MTTAEQRINQLLENNLPLVEAMVFLPGGALPRKPLGIGRPTQRAWLQGALSPTTVLRACTDARLLADVYVQLRAQAVQGDRDALNDLGWLWLNGTRVTGDVPLARRLLKLAYVLGSGDAAFNLGEQAWYGLGLRVDRQLALSYFAEAERLVAGVQGARCTLFSRE